MSKLSLGVAKTVAVSADAQFIFDFTQDMGAWTLRGYEHLAENGGWKALGFRSPDELRGALADGIKVRLPKAIRQPLVWQLAADGASQREIGRTLGVSAATVNDDLSVQNRTPNEPSDDGPAVQDRTPNRLAPLMSSDSPEWHTPPEVIAAVVETLGAIDLDPCSNSHETPNVPAESHFTKDDNGLDQGWRGRVYMNPPYGRDIGSWIDKLALEYKAGNVTEAVALLPARIDTAWWRTLPFEVWCGISGRLTFSGYETAAPFPSAAVYLGQSVASFTVAFRPLGDLWERI